MRSWRKKLSFLIGLLEIVYAVALLGAEFQETPYHDQLVSFWLTDSGHVVYLIGLGVSAVIGLYLLLRGIFKPTTVPDLTVKRDGSQRLSVNQHAVERLVEKGVTKYYEVTNVEAKVKLKRSGRAIVKVSGTALHQEGMKALEEQISQKVKADTETLLGVPVDRVQLRLNPYREGQKISVA